MPRQVQKINEFIASEVAKNDCLVGLGTMHPESEDIISDLNHLKELGLKGVKIHPDYQGTYIDTDGYYQILKSAKKKVHYLHSLLVLI